MTHKPATALPWREAGIIGERINLISADGSVVAHVLMTGEHVSDAEAYANARHIVDCVNENARLKSLNAQMVELLQEAQKMRPMLLRDYGAVSKCVLAYCNLARAMLAKQRSVEAGAAEFPARQVAGD